MFATLRWRATETKIDPVGPSQADGVFCLDRSLNDYNEFNGALPRNRQSEHPNRRAYMIPLLDKHIVKEDWQRATSERNGFASTLPLSHGKSETQKPELDAGLWEPVLQEIVSFHDLGENWDGQGAAPPTHEAMASAIGLANLLHQQGVAPPSRVVPGVAGELDFEWQTPDGTYLDVEIVGWLSAEVMLIEPGMPAKHWTLPTE
jgi:hypothetical protein